jgi:hypothetical protein
MFDPRWSGKHIPADELARPAGWLRHAACDEKMATA